MIDKRRWMDGERERERDKKTKFIMRRISAICIIGSVILRAQVYQKYIWKS